jgi:sugar (pentulose or hexulose) kinase
VSAAWRSRARLTGGAPSLSGRDPLGHLLWLRAERPELYAGAACFLEPVDWLGLRLTGRAATTCATATLHWVTDTRDVRRVRYDDRLVALAGLERAKLPELLPTNAVLGPLTEDARAALGLPQPVPVVAGTPDTMSAAMGRRRWRTTPPTYTSARRHGSPVTSPTGVVFTPWLNGERTPVDDHLVRGGLHNLSLDTTLAQVARAVLEGGGAQRALDADVCGAFLPGAGSNRSHSSAVARCLRCGARSWPTCWVAPSTVPAIR